MNYAHNRAVASTLAIKNAKNYALIIIYRVVIHDASELVQQSEENPIGFMSCQRKILVLNKKIRGASIQKTPRMIRNMNGF